MRDQITTDWGWKLFSIILAVGLWITVHKIYEEPKNNLDFSAGNTVTYENLPVLVVASGADVSDFRIIPNMVSVTVSGPPDVMGILQANKIHAVADLTGIASVSDLRVPVDVSTPPGVTLIGVDPPKVGVIMPPKH